MRRWCIAAVLALVAVLLGIGYAGRHPEAGARSSTVGEASAAAGPAADRWERLWWIDKVARTLRAGEGLGPGDDAEALARLPDDAIVQTFMRDPRFGDTVLDFNLYFLGFKSDSLKIDGAYDRSVFGFANAIASAQALVAGGDYFKLFDLTGPFYMAPLRSEPHDDPPAPGDAGLTPAQLRMKVAIEIESEITVALGEVRKGGDPKELCERVSRLVARESELTERVHRGFDDSEIFVLIRGRVLSGPFAVLRDALEEACLDRAPQPGSLGVLKAGLEQARTLVERAFDEIATFEPARYRPRTVSEFRALDLAALPTRLPWPAFGYEQGLALANSSTNLNRKRAAYVLKHFFCDDLVPIGVEQPQQHGSDVHASQMSCFACHHRLDPMAGFFRNHGAYFYDYSDSPFVIFDDLASVERRGYEAHWLSPHGGKPAWNVGFIRSPRWQRHNSYGQSLTDLSRILRTAPEVKRCLTRRLVDYLVAEDQSIDAGYLDHLAATFSADARRSSSAALRSAMASIVRSNAFRQRSLDPTRCYDGAPKSRSTGGPPCRIASVLARNCGQCHGQSRKAGGLDLTSWVEKGEGGTATKGTFRHIDLDGRQLSAVETLARMSERLSVNDPRRRMPLGKIMAAQERQELFIWVQQQQATRATEVAR